MEVVASIWTTDDHEDEVVSCVQTKVVHRWLQQTLVGLQPVMKWRWIWYSIDDFHDLVSKAARSVCLELGQQFLGNWLTRSRRLVSRQSKQFVYQWRVEVCFGLLELPTPHSFLTSCIARLMERLSHSGRVPKAAPTDTQDKPTPGEPSQVLGPSYPMREARSTHHSTEARLRSVIAHDRMSWNSSNQVCLHQSSTSIQV